MYRLLILITLIVLSVFYNYPAIKYILGRFFYSTSGGGGLFATLFAFSIILTTSIYDKKIIIRYIKTINLIFINIIFIISFLLTIKYFKEFSIDLKSRVIHWQNFENSFNSISHSHILKPLNSNLISFIPSTTLFDLGKALSGFINHHTMSILTILYLVSIISTIIISHNLFVDNRKRINIIFLTILTSISITKSLTDGGIFTGITITYLLLWHTLLIIDDYDQFVTFWRKRFYLIIILLSLQITLKYIFADSDETSYGDIIFHFSILATLIFWDTLKRNKVFLVIIFLYILSNIIYNYPPMNQNSGINRLSTITIKEDFEPLKREFLNKTYYQIYKISLENPEKPKNTVILDIKDNVKNSTIVIKFIPLKFNESVKFLKNSFIDVQEIKSLENGKIEIKLSVNIGNIFEENLPNFVKKNNFYVILHILNRYFQKIGINEYILIVNEFKFSN